MIMKNHPLLVLAAIVVAFLVFLFLALFADPSTGFRIFT